MATSSDNDPGGDGSAAVVSFSSPDGWTVESRPLPSSRHLGHDRDDRDDRGSSAVDERRQGGAAAGRDEWIVLASIPLSSLYADDDDARDSFAPPREGGGGGGNGGGCATTIGVEAARAALADYAARSLSDLLPNAVRFDVRRDRAAIRTMGRFGRGRDDEGAIRRRRRNGGGSGRRKERAPTIGPYVLERTDCAVTRSGGNNGGDGARLQIFLRATFPDARRDDSADGFRSLLRGMLSPMLDRLARRLTSRGCYEHAACVVLQRRLRAMLQPPRKSNGTDSNDSNDDKHDHGKYLKAVAFVADGSILPRRSGRSSLPMSSPPAVPFVSPESEQLTRVMEVEVGTFWRRFLNEDGTTKVAAKTGDTTITMTSDTTMEDTKTVTTAATFDAISSVRMRGMIIPCGVTLIVGGGYHGKSTLLQHALVTGVYDKPPSDGRERCVSHPDCVSVRAEDGRHASDVNVSAFISDLPSGESVNGASVALKKDKTTRFRTGDASGSTSQAANVIEALESGASALLVDEDVSAANFMARDGRMRAMIMDEPITPLLYRVNGLYLSERHKVSTVIVVGGVGEWLDVADAVILMKDYRAHDGLEKARSVSYQFSYGHVQYAGRGVVHRLPWEAKEEEKKKAPTTTNGGTDSHNGNDDAAMPGDEDEEDGPTTLSPLRRRPDSDCVERKFRDATVHVLDGSRLCFYRDDDDENDVSTNETTSDGNGKAPAIAGINSDDDEDDGMVDMSKCSQLAGGDAAGQLYGCGLCVLWLLAESRRRPEDDLPELLDRMERVLDREGMNKLAASLTRSTGATAPKADDARLAGLLSSPATLDLFETTGFASRPRRHEAAMALARTRGMRFEILPERARDAAGEGPSPEDEARRKEEESRKRALAELWANRRRR